MNKKVTAITVIVAILAAAIMVGCVEKGTPISNSDFKNISADALNDLAYQLVIIKVATDSGEFTSAKLKLAAFNTSVKQYTMELEEMNVAENAITSKRALIIAFEETQVLGVYFAAYLEDPTVDKYVRYKVQGINVMNQMEIVAMLTEDI